MPTSPHNRTHDKAFLFFYLLHFALQFVGCGLQFSGQAIDFIFQVLSRNLTLDFIVSLLGFYFFIQQQNLIVTTLLLTLHFIDFVLQFVDFVYFLRQLLFYLNILFDLVDQFTLEILFNLCLFYVSRSCKLSHF